VRKLKIVLATLVALALAMPALAADFKFSGDLNHRFLFTNQAGMYSGVEGVAKTPIDKDDISEFFGEIKYRLITEASTNDAKVKGVYAIELGALKFGNAGNDKIGQGEGGGWSGDGVNIETRWAYTDIQLPTAAKSRLLIGLQPFTVNKYVWSETAMGVQLKGDAGPVDYTLAWMRGDQSFNNDSKDDLFEDADAFLLRGDIKPAENVKLGMFVLYERANPGSDSGAAVENYLLKSVSNVSYDLYTLGVDGGLTAGNLFANWDLMYQDGDGEAAGDDLDMHGYFVHADLGVNIGETKLTYTGWYASGDDDDNDNDRDNFIATDVDTFDSVIFFEGGYTDDNQFTEAPYLLNKGLIFNKLAVDHQATEKVKVGAALLYLMTAEDLTLADNSKEDKLGTEIDAYVSYQLYPNVQVALNAGYLFADDAMDFWEVPAQQDGKADTNIYRSTMQVRYSF
jgi:hypothetical protein